MTKRILFILSFFLLWQLTPRPPLHAIQEDPNGRFAGDKTFTYRNGIWIDDAYEPTHHPVYRVGLLSAEYPLVQKVLPNLRQYQRLGDHLLIVHQGWAIELVDGSESGPLLSTETKRPLFLNSAPSPIANSPQPLQMQTHSPALIATTAQANGISFSFFISWVQIIGIVLLVALFALGIWLGLRPQNQTEAP